MTTKIDYTHLHENEGKTVDPYFIYQQGKLKKKNKTNDNNNDKD